jgi:flagellar hook-associated protein 3 FlgL
MMFDAAVTGINQQMSSLVHLQEQISANKRILTPSDDPVAAARAIEVQQSLDTSNQFSTNQKSATSALDQEDSVLGSASDIIGQIRDLAIQAGDPGLSATTRHSIATSIRSLFDNLKGVANSTDGAGNYLFSGFQGKTAPFSGNIDTMNPSNADITYSGDDGQRVMQIAPSRYIAVSDSGSDVFMRTGNSESVFKTIATLVGVLEGSLAGNVSTAVTQLTQANSHVVDVRASVGSRGNEVTTTSSMTNDLTLQYTTQLSSLQDLDMVKALTQQTQVQTNLTAAEKSFATVSQLSLFTYL